MHNGEYLEDLHYIFNYEEIRGFQEFSEGIKLEIDINSPLFDIFYKSKLFGELFIIPIDFNFINNYKLKEDYINIFNKLNDINSNYSSIILEFNDDKDISHLTDFNIKFNKIKNLNIKIFNPKKNFDYNSFYRELFSLKDIENNIIDLYIKNYSNRFDDEIDENILENLNKFKKLENLKLDGLNAKNIFELKIKTLKALNIEGCQNISINSDIVLSLKKLISQYNISKSLLKLPQLEYLDTPYFSSIDFNSLNNLKKIKFYLGEQFTKILAIKSLKKIHITGDLDDLGFDLASIHDKNPSVNKLIYNYIKENYYNLDYNINEILNKFPNLTELIFKTDLSSDRWCKSGGSVEINLEIKENSNCKINKITLLLYFGNIKVYCQNFENLEKFEIKAYKIVNISTSIPMLSNNRNIIYKFLIELYLHLEQQLINLEIFKNLNNSIDTMQNLKRIDLYFMTNIDKNNYEEFIKKILSLKLDQINIDFKLVDKKVKNTNESYSNESDSNENYSNKSHSNENYFGNYSGSPSIERCFNDDNYYSYEELKRINKNILYLNFENIKIKKYPDNK